MAKTEIYTNDATDKALASSIIARIIEHFKAITYRKYKRYEEQRDENEVFVHEILKWYFGYRDIDRDNPPARIIVGDAIDEYLKHALDSDEPVIHVKIDVNGKTFKLTGKPDAVLRFGDRRYVVEIKYSKTLKRYHVLQSYIYAWMLRTIYGDDNIRCVVVALYDDINVFVFEPEYEFAETVIMGYLRQLANGNW